MSDTEWALAHRSYDVIDYAWAPSNTRGVTSAVDAFLADSVVAAEGKLFVQGGGWNIITVPTFPVRQPRIGVGIFVHVPYTATNQMHSFSITLRDQDGNNPPIGESAPAFELPDGAELPDGKIRELKGAFNVGRPPFLAPGDEQVIPIALNIDGLQFKKSDVYAVVIAIDDTEVRTLSFRVQSTTGVMTMPGIAS